MVNSFVAKHGLAIRYYGRQSTKKEPQLLKPLKRQKLLKLFCHTATIESILGGQNGLHQHILQLYLRRLATILNTFSVLRVSNSFLRYFRCHIFGSQPIHHPTHNKDKRLAHKKPKTRRYRDRRSFGRSDTR